MPLVTLMLPVKMATPLSVIVGTATALYATWLSRKETDWRSAMVLIIFSFLGIPVGLYALSYLPDHFMKVGLGGFLILYSFYSMFIPRLPIYDRSWIAAPIGAVAGALGAAFSTNGPPMVIYGMLRNLGPAAFRGTLNAFFTANNIAVIGVGELTETATMCTRGHITKEDIRILRDAGFVGDLAMNPIREDGSWNDCPLTDRLLNASMECLRNIDNVILVACGDAKVGAIRAALKTGCIDILITDETTGRKVLCEDTED